MELFEHLITWWLSRPAAAVIGILVTLEAGLAGILYFLVSGRWTGDFIRHWCRIDPMMVMPIALIFSLLVGFLGAEIRQRNQQAGKSVADEARALDAIHALTRTSHGRLADVRDAASRYATVVVEQEFPQFGNVGENPAAVAAVDDLERLAAEYAEDRDSPTVAAHGIMDSVIILKKSREERSLLLRGSSEFEWLTVITLSLMSIATIALGRTDSPRMMVATWAMFIPAVVIVLGLLALRENPFSPPLSISPAPLEAARLHLSAP